MTQSFLLLGSLTLEMGFLLCNPMLPNGLRAHALGSSPPVSWMDIAQAEEHASIPLLT